VLLGSALRLFNLNYQSLWYDELHSIIPTDPDFTVNSIVEYAKTDQPPLFFLYLHVFFKVFGYSEQMARLASAVIGILGIPAVYFLGKEIKDKQVGLFASLLTCVNYYQLYYSQEVRFYGLAFLLSTLSFLFFIRVFKQQTFTNGFFYIIATSALLYTHYYGIVIFVTQFIIFIVLTFYKRDRQFIYSGLVCGIIVAISFIPWLPTVLQDSHIQSFWIKKPDVFFLARYFYDYVGKDLVSSIIFLVLGVLFLLEWRRAVDFDKSVLGIVAGWIVLSYLIPYLKSIVGTPLLYVRYTIVTLPAWFILLAVGWRYINHHLLRTAALSIILFSSLLNLTWRINFYYRIEKSQYREITQLVKDKNTNELPVLSAFSWHFNFYFRNYRYKVAQLPAQNFPTKFWLLQSHSPIEMSKELNNLKKDFQVKESINLYQTNAYLLQAKE
jgi:uncharacterized membrane protein